MIHLICDFCSDPEPEHRITCKTFDVGSTPFTSVGDFAVCGACFSLITAGDRAGLLDRSRKTFIADHGTWGYVADDFLAMLHASFWKNAELGGVNGK